MNDTVATIKVLHCASAQHAACKHRHAIGGVASKKKPCLNTPVLYCWLRQTLLTAQYPTMTIEMCEFNPKPMMVFLNQKNYRPHQAACNGSTHQK